MADDGHEGDTGRKPLPRPDREFAELEDSFSERDSVFFEEFADEAPGPTRPEPEDFGFDEIARDDEPSPRVPRTRARSRGGRGVRSSGGSRGGSGRGGGGGPRRTGPRRSSAGVGGLSPGTTRLLLGALFAVVLIGVLALVIRDCRHDAMVDSYKQYVNGAAQVSEESAKQGEKLLAVLLNDKGKNAAALQKDVRALANQAEELRKRAEGLSAPGRLSDADRALQLGLTYRATGLRELEGNIPEIIQSENVRAGNLLKQSMQMFLASDVLIGTSFSEPTSAALRDQGIQNVAPPDPAQALFLRGTNDRYATDAGAKTLLPRLRHQGGGTDANGGTGGNLRGTNLVSVSAEPGGTPISTSGTELVSSPDLKWRVTVKNGGDFQENSVKVTVTLTYPGSTDPASSTTATIPTMAAKEQKEVVVDGPPQDKIEFATQGTLRVSVAPVQGEKNVANNSASYPITITIG